MSSVCPVYNTHRMIRDYAEQFYLPVAEQSRQLQADQMARARALAAWRKRVESAWRRVVIRSVETEDLAGLTVGDRVRTSARVDLAGLAPEDVAVELYIGRVAAGGDLVDAEPVRMQVTGEDGDNSYVFQAHATLGRQSGLNGHTVRVLPAHPDLATPFRRVLIVWA